MFGTENLVFFVLSGLLLNIAPGPDTLYILGRTSTQGVRGGAVAALGIGTGCCVHIFAAALGLSAILAASAAAFSIVKLIGAAYIIYIGIGLLRSRSAAAGTRADLRRAPLRTVFLQGFLTNVLNPKVALFFLAFLPQFIAPHAPSKTIAFLFLGLVFDFNGTLWNLFLAWSAAHLIGGLRTGSQATAWFNRSVGALLVFFGLRLALGRTS